MVNPQPSDTELSTLCGPDQFMPETNESDGGDGTELKQATADHYLDLLVKYRGGQSGKLLEIGCGHGEFLDRAATYGFDVTGIDRSVHACDKARSKLSNGRGRVVCGELNVLAEEVARYDVCVVSHVIQHVRNPRRFVEQVHRLLKTDGVLFIAAPNMDSRPARQLKDKWTEFKPEHFFYFSAETLQSLLFHCSFGDMVLQPSSKSWRQQRSSAASKMIIMAQAQQPRKNRKLSLVVPVFNEAPTLEHALKKLLAKEVRGIEIEIIVVESNSTDGSRDIVLKYKGHPRVNLVLEDRPRGKGYAVRTGLKYATGDFILIQDADLEYDLEDYEVLLDPLMTGRKAFVLGARHGGRTLKMRHFADQPLQGVILNIGHWIFTALIDVFCGLKLRDPFTMYKVFRRDCLYGLTFECDRFDFDFELLIKLVRKGYQPIEIPVNYRSRSFKQGKKVSVWRDPPTWLSALVKSRFCKMDVLAEIKRARQSELRDTTVRNVEAG
jgi:glycosyltransferase involved in cell wall biosynthesis/2-polyprenyl-3-methyl-5-hydroxy-6-metoxy-1,4-benzoquinol methylase